MRIQVTIHFFIQAVRDAFTVSHMKCHLRPV